MVSLVSYFSLVNDQEGSEVPVVRTARRGPAGRLRVLRLSAGFRRTDESCLHRIRTRFTWLSSLRTRGSQAGPRAWCRAPRDGRALRFLLCLWSLLFAKVMIHREDSSPDT